MGLLLLLKSKEEGVGPAPAPPAPEVFPGRPVAVLEISYEHPGDDPVWIDESAYLRRFSIHRGRSNELDRQEAGTATLWLDNRDGRFDPVNTGGAHYPNVIPMRRVRMRTTVPLATTAFTNLSSHNLTDMQLAGDTEVPFYAGFVESWSQTWALSNGDAWVEVRCVDAFKVFNLTGFSWGHVYDTLDPGPEDWPCGTTGGNVTPSVGTPHPPDELTGERLVRVLDCAEWPEADRVLDPGTITIWGSDVSVGGSTNIIVSSSSALAHMLDIALTEGGYVFMDTQGRVRFIDADHIPDRDTTEVYGGSSGEIHYRDIAGPFDDSRLWNDVTVSTTRSDLTSEATAEDATSINHYWRRSTGVTLLPTGFATLDARAAELLARYQESSLRIEQLVLVPSNETEWRQVLTHDLADKVLVRKRPAVAPMIERELRIEGIHIDAPGGVAWVVTWTLSGF